ncbi:MAG: hypothetical protein LAO76_24455 [Acidobacteriia bacterium]|nr:hypothetical protein [Terriglobia bacterium]
MSDMNISQAAFWSVVVMAVVAVIALFLYEKIAITLKGLGGALLKLTGSKKPPVSDKDPSSAHLGESASADGLAIASPAALRESSRFPAWLSRHWLKISVTLTFAFVVMPFWWWNCHPEAWKLELSTHISEAWGLWKLGPKAPMHEAQSGHTLQGLTRLLDGYADILGRDPHRAIEVWVVDHYWQYWNTDTFNDYMRANRRFVDSGGKIHRMFILADDDLKNPQVTAVLRNQCEKIGADVWRGDAAAIANKAEYQITANSFKQMPYTETGFQSFDVLQLEDLTYYSSDFSPDYRVVGASTWFYGQTLDLKPLFNKSIAQKIDCSSWRNQVAQSLQSQ